MTASGDGRFVAEHRPHSAVRLDRRTRRIVAWFGARDRLHLDERARPFHRMLAIGMRDRGVEFVHAALVASDGKGALLAGAGGSGKSTAVIACLLDGLDFLGDDFVGLAQATAGSTSATGCTAAREDLRRLGNKLVTERLAIAGGDPLPSGDGQPAVAAESATAEGYEPPRLVRYDDMAEIFALDPPLPELPPLPEGTDP